MRRQGTLSLLTMTTIMMVLSVSAVLALPASLLAENSTKKIQAEHLVEKGNQFYQARQYGEAIDSYRQAVGLGFEGAALYYNLGDAYYREGRIGYAILYYEKALRLSPGDPDIVHNLRIANSKTVDRIETMPKFFLFQWWEDLLALFSTGGWERVSYVFYLLLLASVGLYFFARRSGWQRFSALLGFVSLVFLLITGTLWVINLNRNLNTKEAIVVEPAAVVKLSPDSTSNDAFIIHEGLKVKEVNAVGHWTEIQLQDGKVGWIPDSAIGTI